jgi:PhnB protein
MVVAQLSVRRGPAALEFYAAAFGAVVDYVVGDEEIVAQLSIGDSIFWVSDEAPDVGNFSPETVSGCTTRLLLIGDDPDAAVERAVSAGASLVYACADAHGWRLGRVLDPFGHHWEIGRPLGEWPHVR